MNGQREREMVGWKNRGCNGRRQSERDGSREALQILLPLRRLFRAE